MDKYLNDETVWGQGSSVWLWPFTSNLTSAQWKAIGRQPPHSSQSLLLYVEVWLGQWLMTVSGWKQSAVQVISNPPAWKRMEKSAGSTWLVNREEQAEGNGKEKEERRWEGIGWRLQWRSAGHSKVTIISRAHYRHTNTYKYRNLQKSIPKSERCILQSQSYFQDQNNS